MKCKNIIRIAILIILLSGVAIFGGTFAYARLNPSVKTSIGFKDNIIFRIDDLVCTKAEFAVVLYDKKLQYDNLYSSDIWDKDVVDISAETFLKEQTLNQLAVYKCIRLLAENKKVYLSDSQKEQASECAKEYMSHFTEGEIAKIGIKESAVREVFEEQILFDKLFNSLTTTVDEEISVDEARVIKIQYIYVPADAENAKGSIDSLYQKVLAGDSFEKLAIDTNKDMGYECLLTRKTVDEAFENAAFNLSTDETSAVVSTDKGYYIIKCLNDYEKAATENNKLIIMNDRKNAIFSEIYKEYVDSLYYELNTEALDSFEFDREYKVSVKLSDIK